MLQPLLEGLRCGDEEALIRFEDVTYKDFVEDRLVTAETKVDREEALAIVRDQQASLELNAAEEKISAVVALLEQGQFHTQTAQRATRAAVKELGLLASEAEIFKSAFQIAMDGSPRVTKGDGAKRRPKSKTGAQKQSEPDDLREIVKTGAESGLSGYEALKAAGIVKPPGRFGSKE